MSDWGPPWCKRWRRKAELFNGKWGMKEIEVLQVIFDVTLAKVDETGLYLVGTQRSTDEASGQLMEWVQVWWCQPIQSAPRETGFSGEPATKMYGAPQDPTGAPECDPGAPGVSSAD